MICFDLTPSDVLSQPNKKGGSAFVELQHSLIPVINILQKGVVHQANLTWGGSDV